MWLLLICVCVHCVCVCVWCYRLCLRDVDMKLTHKDLEMMRQCTQRHRNSLVLQKLKVSTHTRSVQLATSHSLLQSIIRQDSESVHTQIVHVNGLPTPYKIFRHPPYGHVIKLCVWRTRVLSLLQLQQCSLSRS